MEVIAGRKTSPKEGSYILKLTKNWTTSNTTVWVVSCT